MANSGSSRLETILWAWMEKANLEESLNIWRTPMEMAATTKQLNSLPASVSLRESCHGARVFSLAQLQISCTPRTLMGTAKRMCARYCLKVSMRVTHNTESMVLSTVWITGFTEQMEIVAATFELWRR